MKHAIVFGSLACGILGLVTPAHAVLVSGQDIISAPISAANSGPDVATNLHQQAFNERQGVTLLADIAVDDAGTISAGTIVNSHMIFLNRADGASAMLTDSDVTWTFENEIIGVMSDGGGTLEGATSGILGALGTFYPGAFLNRGLEALDVLDGYTVSGNSITVSMHVSEPGDWIRVVTTPAPGAAVLALLGLGGARGLFRRRTSVA